MTHAQFVSLLEPQDFLALHFEYLPAGEWSRYEKICEAYLTDGEVAQTLNEREKYIRDLALSTWPARYALDQYLNREAPELEWQRLLSVLQPETVLLLKRLKLLSHAQTLDEAFEHEHASFILFDDVMNEVGFARAELRVALWQELQESLEEKMGAAERILNEQRKQLRQFAEQVLQEPEREQEILTQVKQQEHALLFGGVVGGL